MAEYYAGVGIIKIDERFGGEIFLLVNPKPSHTHEIQDLIIQSAKADATVDVPEQQLVVIRVKELQNDGFTRISQPVVVGTGGRERAIRFETAVCTGWYLEEQQNLYRALSERRARAQKEKERRLNDLQYEADQSLSSL